jgi:hypothetical protein
MSEYPHFDPVDKPLAYFITIRTFGTWLHGDSVVRLIDFTIATEHQNSNPTHCDNSTNNS